MKIYRCTFFTVYSASFSTLIENILPLHNDTNKRDYQANSTHSLFCEWVLSAQKQLFPPTIIMCARLNTRNNSDSSAISENIDLLSIKILFYYKNFKTQTKHSKKEVLLTRNCDSPH